MNDVDAAMAVWHAANTARGKPMSEQRIARVRVKLSEPDVLLVMAREDGEVVGMALAEPGRELDGAGPRLPGLCHLSMLFVAPHRWGRGHGRLLLADLLAQAAGEEYTRMQVWTGAANERALRLYRGAGFQDTGEVRGLGSGVLAVALSRDLAVL
ncbi:GNAT family N-acetyltransferase [Lentzea cavernae]|uniref:N-acetyltransferase domain-containing protein n=1 Tax=Lentzea cavernae TaxID=2020703 RepID=A0ABQ3MM58_9PSEU|nr:GNAT family N-acetyltransferase [Lentzea cavernae]GHH50525.1 hypothetical protein GCM10017774_59590 [Lentzea cavernae]